MTDATAPEGRRFSHNYMQRADLLPDGKRMRRRLGTLIGAQNLDGFAMVLASELGINLDQIRGKYPSYWPEFLEEVDLRDCLDTITIRHHNLAPHYYDDDGAESAKMRAKFLSEVRRIFREEQISYRVDDLGGVHFLVDTAFEQSRVAVLSGLGKARYEAARTLFEASMCALDSTPPDAKAAVRNTFFAVEGLFRLMFPSAHQLSGSEVQKHLKPRVDQIYEEQKPAIYVAQKQLNSLREWIDAAHFYRHEPGTEEPAQPPIEIAIELVSQGAAWLRWLVTMDKP